MRSLRGPLAWLTGGSGFSGEEGGYRAMLPAPGRSVSAPPDDPRVDLDVVPPAFEPVRRFVGELVCVVIVTASIPLTGDTGGLVKMSLTARGAAGRLGEPLRRPLLLGVGEMGEVRRGSVEFGYAAVLSFRGLVVAARREVFRCGMPVGLRGDAGLGLCGSWSSSRFGTGLFSNSFKSLRLDLRFLRGEPLPRDSPIFRSPIVPSSLRSANSPVTAGRSRDTGRFSEPTRPSRSSCDLERVNSGAGMRLSIVPGALPPRPLLSVLQTDTPSGSATSSLLFLRVRLPRPNFFRRLEWCDRIALALPEACDCCDFVSS